MPSYLITGGSRGLGFEFLRQISQDPQNTVIGIVRDKPATDAKVAESEALNGRNNIFILEADITDYDALKAAKEATAAITSGTLDYLIANAAGENPQELEEDLLKSFKTNAIAPIHLLNIFMPLILKSHIKKILCLSTGSADLEATRTTELEGGSAYAISKAALNMAVVKFNAQYRKEGVLIMAVCPGVAQTGHHDQATPEQLQAAMRIMKKFQEYAPDFKGPVAPEVAVKRVLGVWERASVQNGDGGSFVSQYGNKTWL